MTTMYQAFKRLNRFLPYIIWCIHLVPQWCTLTQLESHWSSITPISHCIVISFCISFLHCRQYYLQYKVRSLQALVCCLIIMVTILNIIIDILCFIYCTILKLCLLIIFFLSPSSLILSFGNAWLIGTSLCIN